MIDGKTTIDGAHILIGLMVALLIFGLTWIKISGNNNVVSIILTLVSGIISLDLANIYINGSLIMIMPDSTVEVINNNSTSQLFQWLGLLILGLTFLQVVLLIFSKNKSVFVNDKWGDLGNED